MDISEFTIRDEDSYFGDRKTKDIFGDKYPLKNIIKNIVKKPTESKINRQMLNYNFPSELIDILLNKPESKDSNVIDIWNNLG